MGDLGAHDRTFYVQDVRDNRFQIPLDEIRTVGKGYTWSGWAFLLISWLFFGVAGLSLIFGVLLEIGDPPEGLHWGVLIIGGIGAFSYWGAQNFRTLVLGTVTGQMEIHLGSKLVNELSEEILQAITGHSQGTAPEPEPSPSALGFAGEPSASSTGGSQDLPSRLRQIQELHAQGLITREEYDDKRRELLEEL